MFVRTQYNVVILWLFTCLNWFDLSCTQIKTHFFNIVISLGCGVIYIHESG